MLGSKRIPKCVPSTSWRNVRPQWKILLSLFLLVSKILLWILAESIDKEWSSLLEVSFLGSCTAVVLSASFKYWSSTTVARRVLGFPRFVRSSVFLASLSSTLYYSEAPIHSIILRIVAFLERAWPVSSMRIHMARLYRSEDSWIDFCEYLLALTHFGNEIDCFSDYVG